jgi:hypothetical protein
MGKRSAVDQLLHACLRPWFSWLMGEQLTIFVALGALDARNELFICDQAVPAAYRGARKAFCRLNSSATIDPTACRY